MLELSFPKQKTFFIHLVKRNNQNNKNRNKLVINYIKPILQKKKKKKKRKTATGVDGK